MNAELIPIHPRWPGAWDRLRGYLEKAIVDGCSSKNWTIDDLLTEIVNGRMQLWGVVDDEELLGAMITKELRFPQRRVLEISFAGADAHTEDRWLSLFEGLSARAKDAGFAAITFGGRKGWARKMPQLKPLYKYEIEL